MRKGYKILIPKDDLTNQSILHYSLFHIAHLISLFSPQYRSLAIKKMFSVRAFLEQLKKVTPK